MNKYDVIVIGAGNGGLIGALSLAKSGKKVLLLERHNIPGGCATSFIRGRFEFEVALHQLSSMNGSTGMILNRLGIMDKVRFVRQKELYHAVIPGKADITLQQDKEQCIEELVKYFPDEKEGIQQYFGLMMKLGADSEKISIKRIKNLTPQNFPEFFEYAFVSTQEMMDRYLKDPVLKTVVNMYWAYLAMVPAEMPFGLTSILYYSYINGQAHHIKGGSQALSNGIISEFEACGGKVIFNTEVVKITVEDDHVKGVITKSGTEYLADYILSNASMITTYVDMIDEGKVPEQVFANMTVSEPGCSICTVYLGLDCPPEEVGITHGTNFYQTEMDTEKIERDFDGFDSRFYGMTCYNIDDPDFSPQGTCAISIVTVQRMEHWNNIPPHQYNDVKYQYTQKVLDFISLFHPGIREHIEEIEISTPITHARYLGHPGGAVYGFENGGKDFIANKLNAVSPIHGLYFGSSWVLMGGFGGAISMGYIAAGLILDAMKSEGE